jgi:signal transduction histidine kinase
MSKLFKVRLGGSVLAILAVASMIAWAAHASWRQFDQLSRRLSEMPIESFTTADQFRANLQELDYVLLRYAVLKDAADRERFIQGWKKLDGWIDVQRPALTTDREKAIFDRINTAYDDYYAVATNVLWRAVSDSPRGTSVAAFGQIEAESRRLLGLGYQLVAAHHDSLARFLEDSQRSLKILRRLIIGALVILLALLVSLSVVVYREMVTPLRVKLVESRAIIERQEKLASLGVLAAGVAHEIRNPLTAVKARLFTQQKMLEPGSAAYEDTLVIGKEIDRLERIVRNVLQFARPPEPNLVPLPADAPLREAAELMSLELERNGIQLRFDGSTTVPLRGDLHQLKQVLINLIRNAADSIGRDGTITLRAREGNERLNGHVLPVIILEVEDTGKGISADVQKRLFDPFFSTKDGGTGLGLALAARIVQKHGGTLQFRTRVHYGTIFGVVLPAAASV